MPELKSLTFLPVPPDVTGTVSWIHLGDLHMVRRGEQNHRDLNLIVDEINRDFAGKGVSFVYLPGDIADDGSASAYRTARECLDRLELPWCGIVGDHDVHEGSFENFRRYISPALFSVFAVGDIRFFRLNTFSEPRPDSFIVDDGQLDWLESELEQSEGMRTVVLMHCYPSDLKQGGARLLKLLRKHHVSFVDMGHTHYNELSNDGYTLYGATRSTGQIEEGPVGYTVISLDGNAVSWHFRRLGAPMLLSITSPADERFLTDANGGSAAMSHDLKVCVRAWGTPPPQEVELEFLGLRVPCDEVSAGVWQAVVPASSLREGVHDLVATARNNHDVSATDSIRMAVGENARLHRHRAAIDQENAFGAWPERDILGTQLGPNKNGKKW